MTEQPVDQAQRQQALDVAHSCIVQAPAGSGKTGLLTQRYLKLLGLAENPEEIIAITFTRKAAAEMRNRILGALADSGGTEPAEEHERRTRALAKAALERSHEKGWQLLDNPQRLRIQTIDSYSAFLSRQMPVLSEFGEQPDLVEDAYFLFFEAAAAVLGQLEADTDIADDLERLLEHLNNDFAGLQGLIADMMGRRDQWLRHIGRADTRDAMEGVLANVVEHGLEEALALIPLTERDELASMARYAAGNLPPDHELSALSDRDSLPDTRPRDLAAWQGLCWLLLTRDGTFRKPGGININLGFPAGPDDARESKERFQQLLASLAAVPGLEAGLYRVRQLPEPRYSDHEWQVLEALFNTLKASVAELRLVFREHGQVDFTEQALAAQRALGSEDEPTDLALQLDYQVKHLLVDEFQDTSRNQYRLFEQLTAGWQKGDGRTLFLVGDPMQSIYGFREAEVGLFLEAWTGRLGVVDLRPVRLSVNFRSDAGIVDWVNRHFPEVFPLASDKESGAVPYTASAAHKPPGPRPAVRLYPRIGFDGMAEAEQVMAIVREAQRLRPGGTTAILVRNRSHLAAIVELLRAQEIRFQAVEIGELKAQPVVVDLMALTRALLHAADRVSWLAVLRSPLCGLSLEDLYRLCRDGRTVPELLHDRSLVSGLSSDGRKRAGRLRAVVDAAAAGRERRPLREWLEGVWLALGGPAACRDDAAAEDAQVYFDLMATIEAEDRLLSPEIIVEKVEKLCAQPDPEADESLQIMTIHKAKGLEFDTVIVPGLNRTPRSADKRLLYWLETTGKEGKPELFFGPVKSTASGEESTTSQYIRAFEKAMGEHETGRLLYVAATRAIQELHLLGHVNPARNGPVKPAGRSLLARLWPAVHEVWEAASEAAVDGQPETPAIPGSTLDQRQFMLPPDWVCPPPPPDVGLSLPSPDQEERRKFEWAGNIARAVGIVVHRFLQHLVEIRCRDLSSLRDLDAQARQMLLREGVAGAELETAGKRVRTALENMLADTRGRWILDPGHRDSHAELPLTAVFDGRVRHLVIDRTFIDDEGVRWIIDYKTSTHEGGDPEAFLDTEQAYYAPQLERYAVALSRLEERPTRKALYYPLIEGGWRELD